MNMKLPDPKNAEFLDFVGKMHVVIVFVALLLNVFTCWKVYSGPNADSGPDSYRAYGWAYGQTTEPIGVKEPVPVLAVNMLKMIGMPVRESAKFLGLASFVLLTALTLLFLRTRYGEIVGSMGALFLAANPYFGYYAARGPGEIFPLFFFLAFWYALVNTNLSFRNMFAIAAFASLAALSKVIFLFYTLASLSLWVLARRSKPHARFALYCALLICAFVSPYFVYQASVYGRPLSLQENLLRRWSNTTIEGPILEAPFNGGPMSPAEFMFGRGFSASASGYAAGLGKVFRFGLPKMAYYYKVELFFGLMGFVLLFMKKKWLLPALFFVFLAPVAFIAGIAQVPATGSVELRFFLGLFWFVCAYAGFGFNGLLEILRDYAVSRADVKR